MRYRLWYALRSRLRRPEYYLNTSPKVAKSYPFNLQKWISKPVSYDNPTFTFLNQSKAFTKPIDWNYSGYGKLWAYHLNYFDYLLQPGMDKESGTLLIEEFIENLDRNREGLEPYPISLRGINWIKFLNRHNVQVPEVDASLYAQYRVLLNNLEYHLMGNHLLENGCSLMFGAWYFRDKALLTKAKEIVREQLDEQILADGAHFELSPMYHRILLDRLMDVYNLMKNNQEWHTDADLEQKLKVTLQKMLGWLVAVSFSNGDVPLVNDSAEDTGPDNSQLFSYADRLELKAEPVTLRESGYRKIDVGPAELFLDVGSIGPDYIPGHAHSDTLSFVLYDDGKPFIVDPGISTYEANAQRLKERSTAYHNTVAIDEEDQSEVWSSFRVGNRAYIRDIEEQPGIIHASHTGYETSKGLVHRRTWKYDEDKIIIEDQITGDRVRNNYEAKAFFHFHPNVEVKITENGLIAGDKRMVFEGYKNIEKKVYSYCKGYNNVEQAEKIEVSFQGHTTTTIYL